MKVGNLCFLPEVMDYFEPEGLKTVIFYFSEMNWEVFYLRPEELGVISNLPVTKDLKMSCISFLLKFCFEDQRHRHPLKLFEMQTLRSLHRYNESHSMVKPDSQVICLPFKI